jgi:hypothetical protein
LPPGVKRIDLTVAVAGQRFTQSFAPTPNQTFPYTWDGKDAFGRPVQGQQPATVTVGYVYNAVYLTPADFNRAFALYGKNEQKASIDKLRQEMTPTQTFQELLGTWNAQADGLGVWSLDVHNDCDPNSQTLYLGDGEVRSTQQLAPVLTTVAAGGSQPIDVGQSVPATQLAAAVTGNRVEGPDGSLYFGTQSVNNAPVVVRVAPDGIATIVAGGVGVQDSGDGGPATQAGIRNIDGLALGPDGSLYIAEASNHLIRRVAPDGIISTFAGTGTAGFSGDGGPARQAQFKEPTALACGPDGSLYMVDEPVFLSGFDDVRVRRIGPDGIITAVAGNGTAVYTGDGVPATQTGLRFLAPGRGARRREALRLVASPHPSRSVPRGCRRVGNSSNRSNSLRR